MKKIKQLTFSIIYTQFLLSTWIIQDQYANPAFSKDVYQQFLAKLGREASSFDALCNNIRKALEIIQTIKQIISVKMAIKIIDKIADKVKKDIDDIKKLAQDVEQSEQNLREMQMRLEKMPSGEEQVIFWDESIHNNNRFDGPRTTVRDFQYGFNKYIDRIVGLQNRGKQFYETKDVLREQLLQLDVLRFIFAMKLGSPKLELKG